MLRYLVRRVLVRRRTVPLHRSTSGVKVIASCSQKLLHYANALLEGLLGFFSVFIRPNILINIVV